MFKRCIIWLSAGLLAATSVQVLASETGSAEARKAAFEQTIIINRANAISSAQKIERLSATLLGAAYVDGNLGEGKQGQYDQNPLSRFDEFDCTTYVETVLAGALSHSKSEFLPNLLKIRYNKGQVSFVTRNHFPSADWLPNNRWLLKDITRQIGGSKTLLASAVIDKKAWYQHMTMARLRSISGGDIDKHELLIELQNAGKNFKPRIASLPYVPLTVLFQQDDNTQGNVSETKVNLSMLNKIPTGSIISMVRPNWHLKKLIGTNMNVSHQSILIRKEGILYLRHASQIEKKVIDVNFVQYLYHYRDSKTLKGFNVQVVKNII